MGRSTQAGPEGFLYLPTGRGGTEGFLGYPVRLTPLPTIVTIQQRLKEAAWTDSDHLSPQQPRSIPFLIWNIPKSLGSDQKCLPVPTMCPASGWLGFECWGAHHSPASLPQARPGRH